MTGLFDKEEQINVILKRNLIPNTFKSVHNTSRCWGPFIIHTNIHSCHVGGQTLGSVCFACKTKLSMVISEGLAPLILAQPWTVGGFYASPNLNMLNSIKPWYYFNNRNGWRLKELCFPSIELISRFSISDALFSLLFLSLISSFPAGRLAVPCVLRSLA